MRDLIFRNLLDKLENCECCDEAGTIVFKTCDINTENNNKHILENYDILRKVYKLSGNTRKPKKLTSSTLLRMARHQKYKIDRQAKYRRVKDLKLDTTYGLYTISIN